MELVDIVDENNELTGHVECCSVLSFKNSIQ